MKIKPYQPTKIFSNDYDTNLSMYANLQQKIIPILNQVSHPLLNLKLSFSLLTDMIEQATLGIDFELCYQELQKIPWIKLSLKQWQDILFQHMNFQTQDWFNYFFRMFFYSHFGNYDSQIYQFLLTHQEQATSKDSIFYSNQTKYFKNNNPYDYLVNDYKLFKLWLEENWYRHTIPWNLIINGLNNQDIIDNLSCEWIQNHTIRFFHATTKQNIFSLDCLELTKTLNQLNTIYPLFNYLLTKWKANYQNEDDDTNEKAQTNSEIDNETINDANNDNELEQDNTNEIAWKQGI